LDSIGNPVTPGNDEFGIGFIDEVFNAGEVALVETMTAAFADLGQAIGQALEAWILFGESGVGIQKFAAQVLAGIAKMAAVQAIYEFAQGLAKLALAAFGYAPAGPSATLHFASSAAYAAIAGVAAVAGRGVAGNSFKQQSGAATGSGGSATSNGSDQDNEFRGQFNGFTQQGQQNQNPFAEANETLKRLLFVSGQQAQINDKLATRLEAVSSADVVRMGAAGAKKQIFEAAVNEMQDNPRAGTDFARAKGEQY
jgi:hypothetical protein